MRGVCELPVLIKSGNSTGSSHCPFCFFVHLKILQLLALFWSMVPQRIKYIVLPSGVTEGHASCDLVFTGMPRFTGSFHAPPFQSLVHISKPPTPGVFNVDENIFFPSALSAKPRRKFKRE